MNSLSSVSLDILCQSRSLAAKATFPTLLMRMAIVQSGRVRVWSRECGVDSRSASIAPGFSFDVHLTFILLIGYFVAREHGRVPRRARELVPDAVDRVQNPVVLLSVACFAFQYVGSLCSLMGREPPGVPRSILDPSRAIAPGLRTRLSH